MFLNHTWNCCASPEVLIINFCTCSAWKRATETFEMYKSVKHIVLIIWTFLFSISHLSIPRLRAYVTAHFLSVGNSFKFWGAFYWSIINILFSCRKTLLSNLYHLCFSLMIRGLVFDCEKFTKNIFSKTNANEYYWNVQRNSQTVFT